MSDTRIALLLSVQRALLDAVPSNLRAVTCDWQASHITLRFVFDGEITEGTLEDAQAVASEVAADFPGPWTVDEDIVRRDFPDPLSETALALWVYRRKESPPDDAAQVSK